MKSAFVCLTAFAVTAAATMPAAAIDIVNRRSEAGASAQGTISEITREGVTVKPRSGDPIKVPANDILSIRWDGEPAKLNLARGNEDGGRFDRAIETYQEVLKEVPAGKDGMKLDVQFSIARATAKMALADATKVDGAIRLLEDFQKAGVDNYRYYDAVNLLGQLYMAKKDIAKARSAFESLSAAPWKDYQMAAKIATAQVLLAQEDVSGALKAFDAVLKEKADSSLEKTRRFEAMLGKSKCLIQQKQHKQALESLTPVIEQAPPEEFRLQAEAYVRQGDCLQAMGKTKEAVLAYLHVPVLFSKEQDLYAESLYHLSRLWAAVDRPERAADARAELEAKYPNSDWTKKLTGGANP